MANLVITNSSELLFYMATQNILKKNFAKAAQYVVMAVAEFRENVDLVELMSGQLKEMNHESIGHFLHEIIQKTSDLSNRSGVSGESIDKVLDFIEEIAPLVPEYGWNITFKQTHAEGVPRNERPRQALSFGNSSGVVSSVHIF